MRKPISQREARRLQKQVSLMMREREAMLKRWGSDYPGNNIDFIDVRPTEFTAIKTAWLLGHAVVLRPASEPTNRVLVYAVRP